jgi:hypothetical protein
MQKYAFSIHQNKCSNHLSWVFLSKVFICQKKEVWGYAKKRETYEALKIAKEKKKKNGTHEGSKVLNKKEGER